MRVPFCARGGTSVWDTKKFFLLDDGTKSWSSLLVFVRRVKERDFFYLIAHIPLLFFALSKYGTLNLRIGEVTLRERFLFMEHNKNLARGEVRVAALFFRRARATRTRRRGPARGPLAARSAATRSATSSTAPPSAAPRRKRRPWRPPGPSSARRRRATQIYSGHRGRVGSRPGFSSAPTRGGSV